MPICPKYVDTTPASELINRSRRVVGSKVLRLLKLWLRTLIEERDADEPGASVRQGKPTRPRHKAECKSTAGTTSTEPVPEALALTDATTVHAHGVSYADDFVIISAVAGGGISVAEGG